MAIATTFPPKSCRAVLYDVDPRHELLDYASLAKQVAKEKTYNS